MYKSSSGKFFLFILALFAGTACNSMIIPFMGFFIVEGLGQEPWTISLYSGAVALCTIVTNRYFAKKLDSGAKAFPLIGFAAFAYLFANVCMAIYPSFVTIMVVCVFGFGFSATAITTMFSLGTALAGKHNLTNARVNAYMRATAAAAWMIGPAFAFLVSYWFAPTAVFKLSVFAAMIWIACLFCCIPQQVTISSLNRSDFVDSNGRVRFAFFLALTFTGCLSFAHSLTFVALPLYYVREAGLPNYAPGLAFSFKTFTEVVIILATPLLTVRLGLRNSLLFTSVLAVSVNVMISNVSSLPDMYTAAVLEGTYYGLFSTLAITFVQSFSGDRPAHTMAIYWNILTFSGFIAGPVVSFIAEFYSFRGAIQIASIVASIGTLAMLLSYAENYRRLVKRPSQE